MLVISETRYLPIALNTISLQNNDELNFYVHRAVYDKAVVLTDRYADKLEALFLLMPENQVNDGAVEYWLKNAPEPINILGPYLKLFTTPLSNDLVELGAALHTLSKQFNVLRYLQMQKELRDTLIMAFPSKTEVELEWESILTGMQKYEKRRDLFTMFELLIEKLDKGAPLMGSVAYAPAAPVIEEEDDDLVMDDGTVIDDDFFAGLFQMDVVVDEPEPEEKPEVPTEIPANEAKTLASLFAANAGRKGV